MGRPRKYEERMSRSIGLRLPDSQYDWLVERTIDFDGDMSEATRDAIDAARLLYEIITSPDPHARLQRLLDESEREQAREAYFDEFGHYPEDGPHEG
jgi:hypothetical protein